MPDLFAAAKHARAEKLEGTTLREFLSLAAGYAYYTTDELEQVLELLPPERFRKPLERSTAGFVEQLLSLRRMMAPRGGEGTLPRDELGTLSSGRFGTDRFVG